MSMRTVEISPLPGDNSAAICAALHELRDGGRLVLAPGRYRCRGGALQSNGRTREPSFALRHLKHVTLEGNGATLVGQDIAGLFRFTDGEDLTIRNLTVDWDPLPHTSGKVVAHLPEQHAFDLEPKIPADPPSGRIVQAIIGYSPEQRRMGYGEVYQTQGERDAEPSVRLANGNLRVFQRRPGGAYSFSDKLPDVGSWVIVRHQVYGYDAFVFRGCANVLLEDVTVQAVPGMAVIGWQSRDLTIRRIRVVPAEGGWMSATADAMHFGGCRGLITVEDSEFAGMGDDAINIHGMYGLVTKRLDDHTVEAGRARMNAYYDTERGTWDEPLPGDVIEYGGGKEPLLPQGQLTVGAARQDAALHRVVITFKEPLPPGVGEGSVLTNVSSTPAVRIRRCHVHGNRARGMLIQTRDVVIEDCLFEDITCAGVHICTDACDWWESLGVRDVTVKGCVFRRNCFWGGSALQIFSDIPGGQSAPGVHKGLRIVGNTFEDNAGGSAIHIGSSEDVEVSGNRIAHARMPVITVVNSRQVHIRDAGEWDIGHGIEVSGSSDRATISVLRDQSPPGSLLKNPARRERLD